MKNPKDAPTRRRGDAPKCLFLISPYFPNYSRIITFFALNSTTFK